MIHCLLLFQMATEMSTLRNQRIDLLKGMKGKDVFQYNDNNIWRLKVSLHFNYCLHECNKYHKQRSIFFVMFFC